MLTPHMTRPGTSTPAPATPSVGGTALPLQIIVMLLCIAPMIALSQVVAWYRTDVVDDQMFAFFGWRIANGATVYLDVWDNKPPGIYWINALAMLLSGGSYVGVIVACVVALFVAHAAFFVAATQVYFRGAATLTTILLSFFLTHVYYTGGTNRTETFLVACELVAVALYLRGFARDRFWLWLVAGAMCGLAFLFKQVGLAAWGAMGLHLIILTLAGDISLRVGLRRCLLLLGGMLATLGLAAGYLAAQGALGDALFATFGFNRAYFAGGSSRFPYNVVNYYLLRNHVHPILLLPILMAIAATIHAFLWWLRPQYRPAEIERPLQTLRVAVPKHTLLFFIWFLVAFYGALLSPMGFRHYLVPCIPPLLFLAGYLVNALRTEASLLHRLQQRAWVLVAFVLMAFFSWEAVRRQLEEVGKVWVPRVERGERAPWELVGDAVKRYTRPDDPIQCFGYMPGVYLHARRANTSRFATTEKVVHARADASSTEIARELEETLRARPPVLIAMTSDDYYKLRGRARQQPWPTGAGLGDWLHENYVLVEDVSKDGTTYLFLRRDRFDPSVHRDLSDRLLTAGAG